ncbi:alpha/beta fold hydrolase [Rhodococcus jostii]|uniref:Lysophospholipase, alpha-beta hydrolase superfamily n=1 Tax=Rhodococcus jostii TaxID=132919 RepID=A0A1H4IKM2_RHOJO|nr:alpha/beta hydrolase [Rhodococcus jostii]SEB34639.1 Lysophospholipase, alpha-beta hydrolase superfamily [Rhodococcus jostii]
MDAEPGVSPRLTMILTHGYGDSRAVWEAQVRAFTPRIDVRTWDLPGHGDRHGSVETDADIGRTTAELEALVAQASRPVVLVGHSVGGYVALRCSLTTTAPVVGVVLISTGPGFRSPTGITRWNQMIDRMTSALSLPAETAQVVRMTDFIVAERLSGSDLPTLVVRGVEDRQVYLDGGAYIATRMTRARLCDVAGAGHDPHRTHASEVNAAIAQFMAELWPGPRSCGMPT